MGTVLFARHLVETGFDWPRFGRTFRQLQYGWLALAVLLSLLTYYGRALRWEVLMRPVRSRPSMWNLFCATAIGFTAVVLFGRAGEPVRPYLISVWEKVSFSSQVAAWMLERIYDLLAILLVFGVALSQVHAAPAHLGPALTWMIQIGGYLAAGLGVACIILLILVRQFSAQVRCRLVAAVRFLPCHAQEKLAQILDAFIQGTRATRSGSFVALLILYTILEWLLIAGCYYCLFNAFPPTRHLGLLGVLIFVGFVSLGGVLQLPGIGGGMQIASVLVLTQLFRLPLEEATGVALLMWVTTIVVIVPPGLLLAFHQGLNWSKLKALEEQASL